ncbi:hypothetical protein GJAV_G00141260 [Gymnothorax javanicus]|nr:hypothetical protein GJAV_G00141260 [Gymnothorax javanicus]
MGNSDSKLNFRKAIVQFTTKTQPVEATDDAFWDQFWPDAAPTVQDMFALIPGAEIRAVREESPSNLATLCYKAVERLSHAADSGCTSSQERQVALSCCRLLTRILPYIFEDPDWRGFFWSTVPGAGGVGVDDGGDDNGARPLAEFLLLSIADLLFCPDFTVPHHRRGVQDSDDDIQSVDSCEHIWEAGVGFAQSPPLNYIHDLNRSELLKLLLTCFSEAMYLPPDPAPISPNPWPAGPDNLFVNYLCRIHREEDFSFILKGMARLLSNPLLQTYLPNSVKKIQFQQELLILFWKICDFNKKFLFFVLKSSHVLDILLPVLYYLNDARADQSRMGLVHICVFILLLLSGERNFGVRLNKPYTMRVPMDLPIFTGTHADLLIIVFHKLITNGHQRLQPLYDCLLTVVVNVSPYLKSLSMVAANKLLHLLEVFSAPWFLLSASQNHHLLFFLLEAFNNIIQYQFDGNSNLVYVIIHKRGAFHQLANLPSDPASIQAALQRKKRLAGGMSHSISQETVSTESSRPAIPTEPGTLKTSLAATPGIDKLTEKSQVSEDGTMVSVLQSEEPKTPPKNLPDHVRTSDTESNTGKETEDILGMETESPRRRLLSASPLSPWVPMPEWVLSWKAKLPLQTVMRLLQVLVPQVEKICIDKGLTDESEILHFLQHGTLVGLLPVPHPILIRKYQPNAGTALWFRTYMWGVVYLRNADPPIWYDTDVKLFEIQRV